MLPGHGGPTPRNPAAWSMPRRLAIDPPASFHDLRRTYGARLARAGVPMSVVAQALGHADERITRKHYAHLAPSYVSETVREHAAGLGIVEQSNAARLKG